MSQLKNYESDRLETAALTALVTPSGSIKKMIKQNEDVLSTKNIGTIQSAKAFLNILPVARAAKKDDIVPLLKHPKLSAIKVCISIFVYHMKRETH